MKECTVGFLKKRSLEKRDVQPDVVSYVTNEKNHGHGAQGWCVNYCLLVGIFIPKLYKF